VRLPSAYLKIALALATGEWLATSFCELSAFWPVALFAALMFALFGYGYGWRHWSVPVVFFLGLALAFVADRERLQFLERTENDHGPLVADLKVDGRITRRGDWVSFESEVHGVPLRVVMQQNADEPLPQLDEIRHTVGWLERRSASDRRSRALWIKGRVAKCERIGETAFAPAVRFLSRIRQRLSQSLAIGVEDEHSVTLLRAMVLGERSSMDYEDRLAFQDAGTMHVFAISGLHIGVIAILIVVALLLAGTPLRWSGLVMMPILWAYVLMIGMPPSAVRAALMASLYFAAPIFWRQSDALVAWSQTFILVHFLDPLQIANVGSLLSFMVMFWLLYYGRWVRAIALPPAVASPGFAVVAWLAGTPIAARVFERVTPGGLLANFAVVPLASLAVICGVIGAVISLLWPWFGGHFNNIAALVVNAMCLISRAVASLPFSNFATDPWDVPMCIGWYLAMTLFFWLVLKIVRRRKETI